MPAFQRPQPIDPLQVVGSDHGLSVSVVVLCSHDDFRVSGVNGPHRVDLESLRISH